MKRWYGLCLGLMLLYRGAGAVDVPLTATISAPTCELALGTGFTGGSTVRFDSVSPDDLGAGKRVNPKSLQFLVTCGGVVGKGVRVDMTAHALTGFSNANFLFNDDDAGAAQKVGFIALLKTQACDVTWVQSPCEGVVAPSVVLDTSTALTAKPVYLNVAISSGYQTAIAGILISTMTVRAAYP